MTNYHDTIACRISLLPVFARPVLAHVAASARATNATDIQTSQVPFDHSQPIHTELVTELIARHSGALVLFARQWCCDPEDALQEALLDLTQLTACPKDPVAWLFTATKRRALNQARGNARRLRRNTISALQSESTTWFENDLERREESQKLQWALEHLDAQERQILVTRIWGNLSFSQIAEVVGSSSSSVHRTYQSALLRLRHLLDQPIDNRQAIQPATQNQSTSQPSIYE